ncbi:hypothetical protein [Streptomyces sp. 2231.1]|uniref:hypothetical protein n=1 Tax=Streptomyces sp. 2231.1 TaxID=1855347 RepID=UPI00115FE319|nr:hypothetical protein [Streptomyces sp. 2231.1]
MVEETGHPWDDVVTGQGAFDVRQQPDLLEAGPYGGIGEDVQQQIDVAEGNVTVEGRPGEHGRDLHHRLVVPQYPAQHRSYGGGELIPAVRSPSFRLAGGSDGGGGQRQQQSHAYGRVGLCVPPFQQRAAVREGDGSPADLLVRVREQGHDGGALASPLLLPLLARALFTGPTRRAVQSVEELDEGEPRPVGGVGGECREERQGRDRR